MLREVYFSFISAFTENIMVYIFCDTMQYYHYIHVAIDEKYSVWISTYRTVSSVQH